MGSLPCCPHFWNIVVVPNPHWGISGTSDRTYHSLNGTGCTDYAFSERKTERSLTTFLVNPFRVIYVNYRGGCMGDGGRRIDRCFFEELAGHVYAQAIHFPNCDFHGCFDSGRYAAE